MIGWLGIVRLGLVQASIGALVMLTTSLLNRVMVVEYAFAAALPAGLVAWHYAIQLSRPLWGQRSDVEARRSPWIMAGMAALSLGSLGAVNSIPIMEQHFGAGMLIALLSYSLIGAGVGAAGTSLLALLADAVPAERRGPAAAVTWIMMVAGIALSAGATGALLQPFSYSRLAMIAGGLCLAAMALSGLALAGLERSIPRRNDEPTPALMEGLREIVADPQARRFTIFVFVSMLAYSMQDLILEPFAGLVFGFTPGQSTSLSGIQHGGVMAGMIAAGLFATRRGADPAKWVVGGCLGSALALAGLASSATAPQSWPLSATVFLLGVANGAFAVAAIASMMQLAGKGVQARAGVRMGAWGAAQAIAFALGGATGAIASDVARRWIEDDGAGFALVFSAEAGLFLAAALLAWWSAQRDAAVEIGRSGAWTAST